MGYIDIESIRVFHVQNIKVTHSGRGFDVFISTKETDSFLITW